MNYKINYQKGGYDSDSDSSSDSELDTLTSESELPLKIPIVYYDLFINTLTNKSNNKIISVKPPNPKCIRTDSNIRKAIDAWFNDKDDAIQNYCHISNWDTSKVTNMKELFKNKKKFNEDVSKWNVSKVTNAHLFPFLSNLNSTFVIMPPK